MFLARIIHKLVRCYVFRGLGGGGRMKCAPLCKRNGLCDISRTAATPLPRWLIKM